MDNKIILTKSYRSITKEYKFKEYFPEIYIKIQSITFPADFSWSQKLYHYLNDDLDFKIGLCPICGNRCTYRNISLGYSKYCSYSCLNKSDEHKSKVKNTINSNGRKKILYNFHAALIVTEGKITVGKEKKTTNNVIFQKVNHYIRL